VFTQQSTMITQDHSNIFSYLKLAKLNIIFIIPLLEYMQANSKVITNRNFKHYSPFAIEICYITPWDGSLFLYVLQK